MGLAEVDGVLREGHGRSEHAASLKQRFDAGVIHVEGVEHQVDASLGRAHHRFPAIGVGSHPAAEAMSFVDHLTGLVGGESGDDFTVGATVGAVHGDLDQVHAVLGLLADLGNGIVTAGDQRGGEVLRGADAGGEPVVQALSIGDDSAACSDTGAFEQSGVDRIAHGNAELATVAGADHGRHAGSQNVLSEEQPPQGAKLVAGPDVDVFLALGIAKRQVGVHVHQPGHDELAVGFTVAGLWTGCLGGWPDMADHAVFDDQCLSLAGVQASAVEQGGAVQVQGTHW